MSDADLHTILWVAALTLAPVLLVGAGYMLHDYFSYDGGQGSDDPRGYNEFTQL